MLCHGSEEEDLCCFAVSLSVGGAGRGGAHRRSIGLGELVEGEKPERAF